MLKLRKIAVTGDLASGKSTVCSFFKSRRCYVVDSDAIVHELLENDPRVKKEVVDLLGEGILSEGKIDRKKVATLVFSDPKTLKKLETLIHPKVLDEIKKQYTKAQEANCFCLFIAELPLFHHTLFQPFFDGVITVVANAELCQKRFLEKTNQPPSEWQRRMRHQLPSSYKEKHSQFILHNVGSLSDLECQVDHIVNVLSQGASC